MNAGRKHEKYLSLVAVKYQVVLAICYTHDQTHFISTYQVAKCFNHVLEILEGMSAQQPVQTPFA